MEKAGLRCWIDWEEAHPALNGLIKWQRIIAQSRSNDRKCWVKIEILVRRNPQLRKEPLTFCRVKSDPQLVLCCFEFIVDGIRDLDVIDDNGSFRRRMGAIVLDIAMGQCALRDDRKQQQRTYDDFKTSWMEQVHFYFLSVWHANATAITG